MRASSDGWSVTVRDFVRPRCWFTARRYGIRPVGIPWITHTVFVTPQHCMEAFARTRFSGVLRGERLCTAMARVPEGLRHPCGRRVREHRVRLPEVAPIAHEGRAAGAPWGRHGRPASRPTRPLRRRRCRRGSDTELADRRPSSPPMHRPDFRESDGRSIFARGDNR